MGRPNRLVRVRDISTGKERDVAPEEATAGFAQGRFGMRRGQEVRIIDADGNPGTIDAEHLGNSIEQHGTRIASDDDFESARFRREHDDLAGAATAAGQGFVREALPFGVGEELLDVAGSDSNRQRMYQDVAPVSSTLGSIGGAIIPLALSGGESAVARGAVEGAEAVRAAEGVVAGAEAAADVARVGGLPVRSGATLAGVPLAPPSYAVAPIRAVGGAAEAAPEVLAAGRGIGEVRAGNTLVGGNSQAAEEARRAVGLGVERSRFDVDSMADTLAATPEERALRSFDEMHPISEEFPGQRQAIAIQEMQAEATPQGAALRERPALAPSQGTEVGGAVPTRPGMERVEFTIEPPTPQQMIPARTAAIEAGVPALSQEALMAEEAMTAGDRLAFSDIVRSSARAVSAPVRGITALGEGASELAGGGIRGALAQGAVEGSIYGASNYVNQSMLEDQPLTAEGLAMAVGEGALFGGGANLALHGVGGLVGAARRGMANPNMVGSFERFMNRSAVGALHPNKGAYKNLLNRFVPGEAGQAAARGGMRNVDDMGAFLIKEGLFQSPSGIAPPSIQQIAERIQPKLTEAGIAVSAPIQATERAGVRVTPTHLRAAIKTEADRLMTSPLASTRARGKALRDEFASLSDHERPSNFHRMRQEFDAKAKFERNNTAHNDTIDSYKAFRRAAQQDLQAAVDSAASRGLIPPLSGQSLRDANLRFGRLAWADKAAREAVAANLAGTNLPLGSLISGTGAAALFGGVSPKALAVGFLSGAVHRWVKENGAALAASGLSAMLKANTLNRVAVAVRSNAVRSVKDAFATAARTGVVRAAASRPLSDKQFQEAATSLYALAHDPRGYARRRATSGGHPGVGPVRWAYSPAGTGSAPAVPRQPTTRCPGS